MPSENILHVKVLAPTQTFYEGPAVSVSAANQVGDFDVLVNHANFFSLLIDGNVVIDTGAQKFTYAILHGIIKVANNKVTLFVYTQN